MDELVRDDGADDEPVAVVREVELPAGTEQVWEALTDPDQVAGWFGAEVTWELRRGAPARFTGDDGRVRHGEVDEVEPGRRLAYRWWPLDGDGRGPASAVRYELEAVPGGTRLVISETPLVARGSGAPTASLSVTWSPWDARVVGLWVACHSSLRIRA